MKEHLDFNLLKPLIGETAQRLAFTSPRSVLTGPAVRKDDVTIEKHLQLLAGHPALKHIYEQLTGSIKLSIRDGE